MLTTEIVAVVRWGIAGVFSLLFLLIAIYNAAITISKGPYPVPFIGGVLGVLAMLIVPYNTLKPFWWMPLIVDTGCALELIYVVRWLIRHPKTREQR